MSIRLKVLVVEDEPMTLHHIVGILRGADIDAQVAYRTDEAIEILNKIVSSKLQLDIITTGYPSWRVFRRD